MSRATKMAYTINATVTVKAVDEKTAVTLLDTMLTRRGFISLINEKGITKNPVVSKAKPAKAEAKKETKSDNGGKKETKVSNSQRKASPKIASIGMEGLDD